jgi:putative tryptophan/tyrosine transport system substrate-binding protein
MEVRAKANWPLSIALWRGIMDIAGLPAGSTRSPMTHIGSRRLPKIFRPERPRTSSRCRVWIVTLPYSDARTGMRRREFIRLVGSATVWPLAARAQLGARMPRLGVLVQGQEGQLLGNWEAFTDAVRRLGWSDGNNIQIEYRFAENDPVKIHALAAELVALKPDIIFAVNTLVVAELQHETKTIPIVFVSVTDPVASGFVASLSHPGGNITGFTNFEPTLVGKHIEILKEIAPGITAVSDMFNPDTNPAHQSSVSPVLEAAARHHAVELISAPVRNDADIERVISSLATGPPVL